MDSPQAVHILAVDGLFHSDDAWLEQVTNKLLDTLRRVESEPLAYAPLKSTEIAGCFQNEGVQEARGFPVTVACEPLMTKLSYRLCAHNKGEAPASLKKGEFEKYQRKLHIPLQTFVERLYRTEIPRTLIVLAPNRGEYDRFRDLLTIEGRGPIVRTLAELDKRVAADSICRSGCTLELALALAQYVRDQNGSSLILCDETTPHTRDALLGNIPWTHAPVRYFTFHVADYRELNEKLLGAVTLRRKAGFLAVEHRGVQEPPRDRRVFKEWGFDPDTEVGQLMELEFSNHETLQIFDRICRESSGEVDEGERTNRYHRVLLSAVRLCKLFANKTLEGTPFDFTLFIPAASGVRDHWLKQCSKGHDAAERDLDLNPVASLLNQFIPVAPEEDAESGDQNQSVENGQRRYRCQPEAWVPFNFDFEEQASNHSELSQSPQLALLLDPETGMLTYVLQKESMFTLDPLRFTQFENFFHNDDPNYTGVFLHGIGGRVELHARTWKDKEQVGENEHANAGDVGIQQKSTSEHYCLEYNGFKWIPAPLHELRATLEGVYNKPESFEIDKSLRKQLSDYSARLHLSRRLEQAIATLLLQQKSSLILLCEEADRNLAFYSSPVTRSNLWKPEKEPIIELQPMRGTVKVTRPVEHLNPVPLAGLLQVDGLHVICPGEGENANLHYVSHFAHRVVRTYDDGDGSGIAGQNDAVGSGTSTAYDLRETFKHSTVVKVSASGSVKILQSEVVGA